MGNWCSTFTSLLAHHSIGLWQVYSKDQKYDCIYSHVPLPGVGFFQEKSPFRVSLDNKPSSDIRIVFHCMVHNHNLNVWPR